MGCGSLQKVRVVIEFRHVRWINDHTMDLLRGLNAGYCIMDMPQVKNLPSNRAEATSDLAYVRFHCQNKAMWEGKASRNQRYDYEYSDEELKAWVPVIASLNTQGAKDTYMYFNNHFRGKAAKNALTLGQHLQR
ncbi:MAG: hypothetical protein OJF50_000767 [Nitrospira sp.]|nr:hypothetical protein [Nitrospira sp.]